MEASNVYSKEGGADVDSRNGNYVSHLSLYQCRYSNPWLLRLSLRWKVTWPLIFASSICALTLTRVFIAAYYKPENVTKQNAIVDLITALEPIIGTINACLPFLPAIVERVTHSRIYKNMTYSFKSRTSASHSKNGTGTSGISKTAKSTSSVSGQIAAKTGKRNGEFEELSDGDIEL